MHLADGVQATAARLFDRALGTGGARVVGSDGNPWVFSADPGGATGDLI
jgi:hypothetical protein